ELERLLALDAAKHKERIVALSKAMYVMTPFTSLLVLESEEMYAQFKVDRGRKDHWAPYPCPGRIKVVYEPEGGGEVGRPGDRPPAREVKRTVLERGRPSVLRAGEEQGRVDAKTVWKSRDEAVARELAAMAPERSLATSTVQAWGGVSRQAIKTLRE